VVILYSKQTLEREFFGNNPNIIYITILEAYGDSLVSIREFNNKKYSQKKMKLRKNLLNL
jgi:hypothetical protein